MKGEYNFFLLFLITLSSYLLSFWLVRNKTMTLSVHRKIWNFVLLISFIISGPLGAFIAFLADNGVHINFYGTILWLHVEAGVVMAIVSLLHIAWHWRYFWKK